MICPYIFFNGNARAALTRYAEVLGGELQIMPAGDMPSDAFPIPDDRKDWVMHGTLISPAGTLMASDNLFGESARMDGAAVQLSFATAAEAKDVFDQLADGGEVTMAWAPTFWSAGFGTCTDQFGTSWMVGCDEPATGE